MRSLPDDFTSRVIAGFGERGRAWLESLPALREGFIQRWSLEDPQPVPQLSYNYLEYARRGEGQDVVLKLGVPNPELETEIRALRCYSGRGAVRLLDADPQRGALLVERILPGTDLKHIQDEGLAARIAGELMGTLWQPAPPGVTFPSAADWCRAFDRYQDRCLREAGPLPISLVEYAEDLSRDLIGSADQNILLHGDLHHGNILLRSDGAWMAIDPKGVIGDPSFEIGPYLYNPIPEFLALPSPENVLDRRLAVFAETTGLDRSRITAWSFCRAVLSAIWSVEDGEQTHAYAIRFAKILKPFLP